MTTRRQLLLTMSALPLGAAFPAFAQQPGKVWRVGVLSVADREDRRQFYDGFLR